MKALIDFVEDWLYALWISFHTPKEVNGNM